MLASGGNIQINLMNYRLEPETQRRNELIRMFAFVGVLIILMGIMAVTYGVKKSQVAELQKTNKSLTAQLAQEDRVRKGFVSSDKVQADMISWRLIVGEVKKLKSSYCGMFEEFDRMNIPGVFISNIDVKPDLINIKGYTNSQSNIADMVAWIAKTKRFGEITSLSSRLNKESGEIEFNISVPWKEAKP